MTLGSKQATHLSSSTAASSHSHEKKRTRFSITLPASPHCFQSQEITLLLLSLEDRLFHLTNKAQILEEVRALRESIEDLAKRNVKIKGYSKSIFKKKERGEQT